MSQEKESQAANGWLMLVITLLVLAVTIYVFALAVQTNAPPFGGIVRRHQLRLLCGGSHRRAQRSKVLLLFGSYAGTVKSSDSVTNPIMTKRGISPKSPTLNGEKLKVNDLAGTRWRSRWWSPGGWLTRSERVSSGQSTNSTCTPSETAVRIWRQAIPTTPRTHSFLRRNADEVSAALQKELQERLDRGALR